MKNLLHAIWNWKTTLGGAAAGVPVIIDGIQNGEWKVILLGVGTFLVGLFAKDHNVTGTVQGGL